MDFMHTGLFWLSIGVMMFIMEMVVPGFVLFFFGVGAWVVALLTWLMPLTLVAQLFVFLISSVISLLVFRRFIKDKFFGVSEDEPSFEEGDTAEVIEVIKPPYKGKVRYSGTTWKALAEERIEVGEVVKIVVRDGLVFRVEKL
ncbi:MAG: NfeD family protein [Desulfotalea sp.]